MNFYVTFGQQYRRNEHPQSLNSVSPHPDGWVRIVADDYDAAFAKAKETFGWAFAGLYSDDGHAPQYYPLGELGVIGEQVSA